jgi:hypothetical protein
MANLIRTMKRTQRRADGKPETNALSPKNTRGKAKGPARSPSQREVFVQMRMVRAAEKAAAEAKLAAESTEKAA